MSRKYSDTDGFDAQPCIAALILPLMWVRESGRRGTVVRWRCPD
jgi:hypothetical protein